MLLKDYLELFEYYSEDATVEFYFFEETKTNVEDLISDKSYESITIYTPSESEYDDYLIKKYAIVMDKGQKHLVLF